ncbi:MAG: hypothetical protein Ct9H300mP16_18900 [Pseudomonadota bacterium]|nr:MAG: hypothetical protein Ct9H300mP16_18900 [Pseudomonadota bacterium]
MQPFLPFLFGRVSGDLVTSQRVNAPVDVVSLFSRAAPWNETSCSTLRMITPQSQTPECKIWVDADACPKVIKEILYRVADRVL